MVHHPSKEACESMSLRLSTINDLRLPAALLREHPYPEASSVQQHLQELLYRDAAVFLEVMPRLCIAVSCFVTVQHRKTCTSRHPSSLNVLGDSNAGSPCWCIGQLKLLGNVVLRLHSTWCC